MKSEFRQAEFGAPRNIIGILQPGYLPWLGFFEQMLYAGIFVIYDDVQYDKHGWRNRNRLKGPDGPVWLTVPVRIKGLNKPKINEVLIDPNQPSWGKKHCATLRQLYAKAPFFEEFYPLLEEVLQYPWERLLELDLKLIEMLAYWLGIEREIILSSSLGCSAVDPTQRLVDICRKLDANLFYEGSAGRNYLDLEKFTQAGIEVVFQDYQCRAYPQLHGPFLSHLSAVDLILNCGPQSMDYLRGESLPPFAVRHEKFSAAPDQ
ncbi:MAG: WbqC family protein [Deltaproteobacteria bacterium]